MLSSLCRSESFGISFETSDEIRGRSHSFGSRKNLTQFAKGMCFECSKVWHSRLSATLLLLAPPPCYATLLRHALPPCLACQIITSYSSTVPYHVASPLPRDATVLLRAPPKCHATLPSAAFSSLLWIAFPYLFVL